MTVPQRILEEVKMGIESGGQPQKALPDESQNVVMARIVENDWRKGPMVTVGNYQPKPRDGRPVRWAGEDPTLLEKTKHVRLRGERLTQFFSRTGVGKNQILTLSAQELAHLVDVVSMQEQPREPRRPAYPNI